jgi:hypothetical protein
MLATGPEQDAVLEDVWWIVSIAGHLLADDGEGERPLVPYSVLQMALSWDVRSGICAAAPLQLPSIARDQGSCR